MKSKTIHEKSDINAGSAAGDTKNPELSPIGDSSKNAEAKTKLLQLEEIIKQNQNGQFMIGRSLGQIDDDHLYKTEGYKSFQKYCEDRWGMSDKHAYRLIKAAKCYDALAKAKSHEDWTLPKNEAQVRPLTKCDENDWVGKWEQILKKFSGKSFTAEDIEGFLFPADESTGADTSAASKAKASAHKAASHEVKKYRNALEKIDELVTKTLDKKTNKDAIPIMKFRKFLERIKKLIGNKH